MLASTNSSQIPSFYSLIEQGEPAPTISARPLQPADQWQGFST